MKLGTHLDRLLASIRRRLIWAFANQEFKTIQLSETKSHDNLKFQQIGHYSGEFKVTEEDPRSKLISTHLFSPRHIYRVEDALLEPRQGLIFTRSNELILDSTNWTAAEIWKSYPRVNLFGYSKFKMEITFLSSRIYYHWLVEDLPNFLKIQERNPRIKVAVYKKAPRYVIESLEDHMGEIIFISGPCKFQEIEFVSKSNDIGHPHPIDLQILRDKYQELLSDSPIKKKIYISRRGSSRSPKNEIQIERLFKQYNFEIVLPEELGLKEQINLFSGASTIAGVHGSGLANMVWLKKGSKVMDLVYKNYWTECFFRLANRLGIEYAPLRIDLDIGKPIDLGTLEEFIRFHM